MKKYLVIMISLLFFLSIVVGNVLGEGPKQVDTWFQRMGTAQPKEKFTKLRFYFHDSTQGKNITAVTAAQSKSTHTSPTGFGAMNIADDPMTMGPELSSNHIGFARGSYLTASREELGLFSAVTFCFMGGVYNGSSISILGYNPILNKYREMPIVGGTGVFRLARGVVVLQSYVLDLAAGIFNIEVNVFALHY